MEEQKKEQILIPEGCFEGYCGGCFHAKRKFVDSRTGEVLSTREGEIFCKRHEQICPESDNGYECYLGRIKGWLMVVVAIWFCLGLAQIILEIIF